MLLGCHCHNHFWCEDGAVCTFDAFRLHLKYPTHRCLFFRFLSFISCRLRDTCFQETKVTESSDLYKSIMVHKRKKLIHTAGDNDIAVIASCCVNQLSIVGYSTAYRFIFTPALSLTP